MCTAAESSWGGLLSLCRRRRPRSFQREIGEGVMRAVLKCGQGYLRGKASRCGLNRGNEGLGKCWGIT